MARPSMTEPNVGLLELNGKTVKVAAVWTGTRFLLRRSNHGRYTGAVLAVGRSIKAIKNRVRTFRLIQNLGLYN